MVVMTAKISKKQFGLVLAVVVALVAAICIIAGSSKAPSQGEPVSVRTNDERVSYLAQQGWDVVTSPVQERQVRIPTEFGEVFERYNSLQVSQGFDLTDYAGKTVTQYVYQVENFPNATDPVYATILVHNEKIIGADITDTSAGGIMQGLIGPQKPDSPSDPTETTEATDIVS